MTPPAPLGWRIGARVVDLLVVGWILVFVLVELVGRLFGGDPLGRGSASGELADLSATRLWLGAGVVVLLYEVVPVALRGATLGKAVLGLRVVRVGDLGRPTLLDALVRAAVVYAPLVVPYVGLVVLVAIAVPVVVWPTRRGLHDLLAGTAVIRDLRGVTGDDDL